MSVFRGILAVALVFFVIFGVAPEGQIAQGVVESQIVTVENYEADEVSLADKIATVVALVLIILLVVFALIILNEFSKGGN